MCLCDGTFQSRRTLSQLGGMSVLLQILGRKYSGRDAYGVLRDESYAKDVLRCGPLLGTTFILRAARDLPLREAAR